MPVCIRCNREVGGLIRSLSFNKETQRCSSCEADIKQALGRFRQAFLSFTYDGNLTPDEWNTLLSGAAGDGLNMAEALAYVRGDALNFLDRMLAFAYADGYIADEEERHIQQLRQLLSIPDNLAQPLLTRLAYLKYLSDIRRGKLPVIAPSSGTHLESGEVCHLQTNATYHKVNARSVTLTPGSLVATSKKLLFLSSTGGVEIPWKSIIRVEQRPGCIYLELSTRKGNGQYDVPDPVLTEAIVTTLVRMAKRQLLAPQIGPESRHIPHEIKLAVWQRDQGKCVQCGDTSYLEFDHIIPHSKGGANTVNNVQLLCRRCNLQKGDRI